MASRLKQGNTSIACNRSYNKDCILLGKKVLTLYNESGE